MSTPHDDTVVAKGSTKLEPIVTAAIVVVAGRIKTSQRASEIMNLAVDALKAAGIVVVHTATTTEDASELQQAFQVALKEKVQLLLTIGGTGVGAKNQVPEVTAEFITIRLSNLEYAIVAKGLETTLTAGISRGVVGLTGRDSSATLIVNSPGSRGGVRDVLSVVIPLMPNIFEGLSH